MQNQLCISIKQLKRHELVQWVFGFQINCRHFSLMIFETYFLYQLNGHAFCFWVSVYLSLKVIAANILGYVNISQKLKVDTLVGVFISIGTDQQLKNLDVFKKNF